MPNIRNDSAAVVEAYRQTEIIVKAIRERNDFVSLERTVADALLDIWQKDQPDFRSFVRSIFKRQEAA